MSKVRLFDGSEYERWLSQAEHTLTSAERDYNAGDHGWACFKAQQAAEFGVKGLIRGLGLMAFGHSILKLLKDLADAGTTIPDDLSRAGRDLDRHYIPPRYPDAYPSGSPFEFYHGGTSREALDLARRLLEFVKEQARNAQGS